MLLRGRSLGWLAWTGTIDACRPCSPSPRCSASRAPSPARRCGALAPNLVPREILPNAIALSSIAWQAGAIAGPGDRRLSLRLGAAHALCGQRRLLFAFSLLCMFMIRPGAARRRSRRRAIRWRQMVDGLRYVRRNRLVLGAITLDLFAVLLGGATAMLPVFARDILARRARRASAICAPRRRSARR